MGFDAKMRLLRLLKIANDYRDAGNESASIALGCDILNAYFEEENGCELPRSSPRTFTEKLYCRMLDVHEHGAPKFSQLSDKLRVRKFVADTIGEQYLVKLLWQGMQAADIPWCELPAQSILKCTEGSGKNLLLETGMDRQRVASLCQEWQSQSYYWFRREYHYWDVPRALLIEELLSDGHPDGPIDYIFFCFDGVPRLIQVGSRSHTIHRFYTTSWQALDLTYRQHYIAPEMPRPKGLDSMLDLASRLSSGFDFVRIDLYECEDGIKFGEMTFTPRAGNIPFQPSIWNEILGDHWNYRRPAPRNSSVARSA